MVETANIEGKLQVEDAGIARFWNRAKSGEPTKGACGAQHLNRRRNKSDHNPLLASRTFHTLRFAEAGVAKWQTHRT